MKKRRNGTTRKSLEEKAQEIIKSGNIIHNGSDQYIVPSQTNTDKHYNVSFQDFWMCDCPYHTNGHGDCKHIIAVQTILSDTEKKPDVIKIKMPDPVCPKCNSKNCKSCRPYIGKKVTSPRYRCKDCKHRFTFRPFALGSHYQDEIITDALEDVSAGKSCAATSRGIEKKLNSGTKNDEPKRCGPDPSTIWRWVKKQTRLAAKLIKKIPTQVSNNWSTDELHFKTKGKGKWLYKILDMKSKFILATNSSYTKHGYNATKLFKKAIDDVGSCCKVLVSDKLPGFKLGFKNTMQKYNAIHLRSASFKNIHINNNAHEAQNGTMRNRIKTTRGFGVEDPPLLDLYIIYHNFIRPHMGLNGKTPAEVLGIDIVGHDKWKVLLSYVAIHCQ